MRKVLLIVGILFIIISLLSIIPYISDYIVLSEYGKGFVVGNLLLMLVGVLLILIGRKKGSVSSNVHTDK